MEIECIEGSVGVFFSFILFVLVKMGGCSIYAAHGWCGIVRGQVDLLS